MGEPNDANHDALVDLLWELKAAWEKVSGEEVLLTDLLLDRTRLDAFLARAARSPDPGIRRLVARIADLGSPASASTATPTASASSLFDTTRGAAVLVASLLLSAAAIRFLFFSDPFVTTVPTTDSFTAAAVAPEPAAVAVAEPVPPKAPAAESATVARTPGKEGAPDAPAVADVGSTAPAVAVAASPAGAPTPAPPATPATPQPPTLASSDIVLRVHGSNTVGEKLSPALVEAFLKARGATEPSWVAGSSEVERTLLARLPGRARAVGIEVHAHGSSTAFQDLAKGTTDLGQSSRRIKPEEVASLAASRGDLSKPGAEHVIALDGLAIIVHPGSRVSSLSVGQVARLFSGQIKDWKEVGGAPGPVTLYARDDVSGTWDSFKQMVLEPGRVKLDPSAKRFESSGDLSDAVARDPSGIGFIGLPYVRRARLLSISAEDGGFALVPTPFTVGTEDYALSRRLYFYAPATSSNETMRELVDFTLGEAGQEVVRQVGFVSQNLTPQRPAIDASAPADYREAVEGAERLSLNFRFEAGSEELDAKGARDLDRIVAWLTKNQGRSFFLLGFTDDRGSDRGNLELSRKRAEVVAKALESRGVAPREVRGFGEALPVASNGTEEGRNRNRRVEVWVR